MSPRKLGQAKTPSNQYLINFGSTSSRDQDSSESPSKKQSFADYSVAQVMTWKVHNTKKQSYSKDPSVSKSKSNFMSKVSVSGTKKLSIASFDEGHNI